MEDQNNTGSLSKLIESAQSVILILPPEPSKDQISSAMSLHLALKESGKESHLGCGSEVSPDPKIFGNHEIADTIGSKNLVISFDYDENDLDKVDYDVRSDGKFYLLVKPKTGSPAPDVSNVKFSYSGAKADLVIVFGISSLEELGKIYAEEKSFLDDANILSINNISRPVAFTPNIIQKPNSSFAEIITGIIEKTGLQIPIPSATGLLSSIYEETSDLTSPKITADTFASLAFLMRAGARLPNQQIFAPRLSQPPFFEVPHAPTEIDPVEPEEDARQVPMDWKQPKIFRAGDL